MGIAAVSRGSRAAGQVTAAFEFQRLRSVQVSRGLQLRSLLVIPTAAVG